MFGKLTLSNASLDSLMFEERIIYLGIMKLWCFCATQVKTWFQNRRMKHKKQLRKAQDERKTPAELERTTDISSESELTEKSAAEMKRGPAADSYMLDDHDDEEDDDVDIEDDICSPDHLL